ncbi:MAG: hypothetical protein E6J90_03135 [Deltaproteobacteria bacterium]|nr:MAG: hypothetical protein E6J91_46450 [Deltaproteobacteria bacterium]TMQ27121.1 MAG: hypothetical protein E6J90_03135 [Deltaproteobacteria bacterium]
MNCVIAMLALGMAAAGPAYAQRLSASALAERSSIIVRGTVVRAGASDEPMLAASPSTAVIKISHTYAGAEIAGDQTGLTATVILSRPGAVKDGTEAVFFGNPRFLGKTITIADDGELTDASVPEIEKGIQARRDAPVRARLAGASTVFRGKVEKEAPLEVPANPKLKQAGNEHDPEWHVATVRVTTPMKGGKKDAIVSVVFAASRDVTWVNSPKLRPGQEVVLITHKPTKDEEPLLRATGALAAMQKQPFELATDIHDVLPVADEARVRGLVGGGH